MSKNNLYSIETVRGVYVDLLRPDINAISLGDIAWALSRTSRFVGHTINEVPYNNAQHSMLVATILRDWHQGKYPTDARLVEAIVTTLDGITSMMVCESGFLGNVFAAHGLLHDAAEAYFGDIPSPAKNLPMVRKVVNTHVDVFDSYLFAKYGLLSHFASLESTTRTFTNAHELYGRYLKTKNMSESESKSLGLVLPNGHCLEFSLFDSADDEAMYVMECNNHAQNHSMLTGQRVTNNDGKDLAIARADMIWLVKMADLYAQVVEAWCYAADRGNVWIKKTPTHLLNPHLVSVPFELSITEFQHYAGLVYPQTAKESYLEMMHTFENNTVFSIGNVVDFSHIQQGTPTND